MHYDKLLRVTEHDNYKMLCTFLLISMQLLNMATFLLGPEISPRIPNRENTQ